MFSVHPEAWQEDKPLVSFKILGPQSEVPIDSAIWGGPKFPQRSILNIECCDPGNFWKISQLTGIFLLDFSRHSARMVESKKGASASWQATNTRQGYAGYVGREKMHI